ncbi:hypothetical protein U27_00825 [Candidatus Vecturithrix granuli]|uniref:Uncharacterized protein n=1 Tax=Vecturithrix granuli TaxID=1499967 RepID=A0A081C8M2_VECG1|nr:hypothetical protein U27_00825 [Candidatus Vecturithrix granuli]
MSQGGATLSLGYSMKPFQGKDPSPEGRTYISPGSAQRRPGGREDVPHHFSLKGIDIS